MFTFWTSVLINSCLTSSPSSFITSILLPLCTFMLHHGLHQWSFTPSAATLRLSNRLIYNIITTDLIRVFVCYFVTCGTFKTDANSKGVGGHVLSFPCSWPDVCVERHLAAVCPIPAHIICNRGKKEGSESKTSASATEGVRKGKVFRRKELHYQYWTVHMLMVYAVLDVCSSCFCSCPFVTDFFNSNVIFE